MTFLIYQTEFLCGDNFRIIFMLHRHLLGMNIVNAQIYCYHQTCT